MKSASHAVGEAPAISSEQTTHKATAQDIADDYSVTPQHITRLANKGDIPGKRVGNVWRFNREEVAAAFEPKPKDDTPQP